MKLANLILIILATTVLLNCGQEEVRTRAYPVVDTNEPTEITEDGALLSGEILNLGNDDVIDHGFVYNVTPNPIIENSDLASLGPISSKGKFTILVNRNLTKDVRYFARAYAKNKNTIVYGQQIEFISLGGKEPKVISFTPESGVIGDTITVVGSGFSNVLTNNIMLVGLLGAKIVRASADSLLFIVPHLTTAGENELTFKLGISSASISKKFTLLPAKITSVSNQAVTFGDTLSIVGENFPKIPSLISASILGQEASIISSISTQIRLVVSNNVIIDEEIGFLQIGTQKINFNGVTKLLPPEILEFIPTMVKQGENLKIKGKNFSPVTLNNKVFVGTFPVEITHATLTELTIKVPEIKAGAYVSTIQRANQTNTSTKKFDVVGPVITQISPLESTWNEIMTITGSGFSLIKDENIVKIGGTVCDVVNATEFQLSIQVPLSLRSSDVPITVLVSSKNSIAAIAPSNFQLKKMAITSFTPNGAKKNQIVEIFGSNLYPSTDIQQVSFGNFLASVVGASRNSIQVKLPEGLIDSQVPIKIKVGDLETTSTSNFQLISPWKKLRDFPESFGNGFSFVINNRPFIGATINEFSHDRANRLWEYRPSNNSWITKTAIPEYSNDLTSYQFGNFGWAGLAFDSKNIQVYDPSNNGWSVALPEFPGPPTTGASVFTIGSDTYITNGTGRFVIPTQTGSFTASLPTIATYKFNHLSQTWSQLANSPGAPIESAFVFGRFKPATFTYNETAFLFSGSVGISTNPIVSDLLAYNSLTDQWQSFGDVEVPGRFDAAALTIGSHGYLIGGQTNIESMNDVWRFDMNSLTWERLENFPGQARAGAVSFVIGGKGYYGAGWGLKDFWEFDPSKL